MNPPETLKRTAEALVEGCRTGRTRENIRRLYAPDAVSVEAYEGGGGMGREVRGHDAIEQKHDWWDANFEEIETETRGPFLHGDDRFSAYFELKTRHKESGEVQQMAETGTYHVDADGRIMREEFFYQG